MQISQSSFMFGDILECYHHFGKYWAVSSKTNICPWKAVICLQKYLPRTVPHSFIRKSPTLGTAHVPINRVTEKQTWLSSRHINPLFSLHQWKWKKKYSDPQPYEWVPKSWCRVKGMFPPKKVYAIWLQVCEVLEQTELIYGKINQNSVRKWGRSK